MRVWASSAAWATLCGPGLHSTPTMSMARRRPAQEAPCAAQPAPARALHHERHRPEQTTLYRLVQQHAASFIAQAEASTGAGLPRFIRDEFDAFLECGILAHGFLRLRCGECGHDKLLAFSCKRRGFCPPCGARPEQSFNVLSTQVPCPAAAVALLRPV